MSRRKTGCKIYTRDLQRRFSSLFRRLNWDIFTTYCTAQPVNKTRTCEMKIWIHTFVLFAPIILAEVRLHCGHGTHSMEVVENTANFTLTCDGYDHLATVMWQRKNNISAQPINIGSCISSNCSLARGVPSNKISITYVSSTNSRLTSSFTARNDDGFIYLCNTTTCTVNIMHPAVVDSCSLNVANESWVGVVLCNISKAYSPSNNYSCDVYRNSSQADNVVSSTTKYSPTNHSDARYRTGSCNFTTHLPSRDGKYSYTAVVYPGGTEKYIDTVVIEQPSDPTIECTRQNWILENTTLNCTSTTRNIGIPPGRLQCFLEDKLLINAGYGEKNVSFNSRTLKRQDNLSNMTCRINWIRNITGQNYTLMITYPPSVPNITGGPFMEESQVNLTCNLLDYGNPPALLSWRWEDDNSPLGNTSRLTLPTVSRRENNRTIICRAENVFTEENNINIVVRFKPVVYYKPVLNIINKMEINKCKLSPNHTVCRVVKGERIHLDCMSDSNPKTESVTWVKVDSNETVSNSSVLNMTVSGRMDNGSYVCTATVQVPNTETIFMSSVQVTILFDYPPTDVRLTLNNQTGNLTIEEGQNVTMICLSDGSPKPTITIHDTSHNKKINSLSRVVVNSTNTEMVHIISSANCQDTTTYRCNAKNSIGQGKESYAALFVLCVPRRDETAAEIPTSLDYVGQAISLTFTVIAYPKPENTQQQCYNSKMVNVTHDKCNVTCTVTNVIYKSKCDVIIDGITSDDAGIFRIRLQNDLGFAKDYITFNVTVNATMSREEGHSLNVIAVVGGIAAAVIIIIIAAVIFFAIKRENKFSKSEKIESGSSDASVLMENTLYATSDITSGATFAHKPMSMMPFEGPSIAGKGLSMKPFQGYAHANKPVSTKQVNGREYVNKPETKKTFQGTEYENVAFNTNEVEYANQNTVEIPTTVNQDGLVYTTVDFSEQQARKAMEPPPQREETEYACVDVSRSIASS